MSTPESVEQLRKFLQKKPQGLVLEFIEQLLKQRPELREPLLKALKTEK
jgi:hypothetical protein